VLGLKASPAAAGQVVQHRLANLAKCQEMSHQTPAARVQCAMTHRQLTAQPKPTTNKDSPSDFGYLPTTKDLPKTFHFQPRGGVGKKMTEVTYICRRAKIK
jgi:hypothetical protein